MKNEKEGKEMTEELSKQDILFQEFPLWFQDSKEARGRETGFLWKDREGFLYQAGYKAPVKIDLIFLLYILLQSQKRGWEEELAFSRYEILKACNLSPSTYWYERLEDSLKRWKMVGVEFQGTFFDGKTYDAMNFGIIDDWYIHARSKELKVRLSRKWIARIQNSDHFKKLEFDEVKSLRTPLATRLYALLEKSFQGRREWSIDAAELAQKISMQRRYPAHIIPKIKSALKQINENKELQVELEVERPERGRAILVFRKLCEEREQQERQKEAQRRKEEERREVELERKLREEVDAWLKRLTAEEFEALREEVLALLKFSGALLDEIGESEILLHMRIFLLQRLIVEKQRSQQAPQQGNLEEKREDKESERGF